MWSLLFSYLLLLLLSVLSVLTPVSCLVVEKKPLSVPSADAEVPRIQLRDLHGAASSPIEWLLEKRFDIWALGDSFASGSGIFRHEQTDGNKDNCQRHILGWPSQLSTFLRASPRDPATPSPPSGRLTPVLHFEACSGSRTGAATLADDRNNQSTPQLDGSADEDLILVQFGGRDVGFTPIVKACIFVEEGGPSYPDEKSECTRWIREAERRIQEDLPRQYDDMYDVIGGLRGIERKEMVPIYHLGYPRFFTTTVPPHISPAAAAAPGLNTTASEDGKPDENWCDHESFGLVGKPKLTHALRSKLNSLVVAVNTEIVRAQARFQGAREHLRYFDVDALFEGKRFCEPRHEPARVSGQYEQPDLWFWNYRTNQTGPELSGALGRLSDESWGLPHEIVRSFHPKDEANTAIAVGLKEQLEKDGVFDNYQ